MCVRISEVEQYHYLIFLFLRQEFRGVVSADGNQNLETQPSKLSAITMQILAACHALVFVDGKTVSPYFIFPLS